jgi:hypothetical protein
MKQIGFDRCGYVFVTVSIEGGSDGKIGHSLSTAEWTFFSFLMLKQTPFWALLCFNELTKILSSSCVHLVELAQLILGAYARRSVLEVLMGFNTA